MKTVVIAYATRYGQTAKIAHFLRSRIEGLGHHVTLVEISPERPDPAIPPETDVVVIGAPVQAGKFPRLLTAWARRHAKRCLGAKEALFTVSLNAADPRPEARHADRALLKQFVTETAFVPSLAVSIAGALNYRSYNWIVRFVMKRISAKAGGPTDTSRDHEMTDWKQVDSFALDIVSESKSARFA